MQLLGHGYNSISATTRLVDYGVPSMHAHMSVHTRRVANSRYIN